MVSPGSAIFLTPFAMSQMSAVTPLLGLLYQLEHLLQAKDFAG
jgi:hypothetical protein